MIKQITKAEWYQLSTEHFYCKQLCHLPYSVQEVENMFGISFFEYTEEGLGICYAAFISIEGRMCLLKGTASKEDNIIGVLVEVKNFEKNLALYGFQGLLIKCADGNFNHHYKTSGQ
ncbi:MAG: hypothetical protein PHU14_08850 [Methylovulum sp.]|nr:hypothetical protein [Methylovulum sp.]